MRELNIKLNEQQAEKIIYDMPTIDDEAYKSMSTEKQLAFHIVLAETFLNFHHFNRDSMVDIGIEHLYGKYSHGDMYERGFIEPNCQSDQDEALFDKGQYDEMATNSWEFLHDNLIDYACEDMDIRDIDLGRSTIYYRESDADKEEIFVPVLKIALHAFKSQSFAMDLESKLAIKADHTKQQKI